MILIAGTELHEAFTILKNYSFECGYGNVKMIRVDTDRVVIFIKSYAKDRIFFRTVLVVDQAENLSVTNQLMDEVMEDLAEFLTR